jgi:hypothetical protein
MVEGTLHNFKNVVLDHPSLIADGHDDIPFGELRHITN